MATTPLAIVKDRFGSKEKLVKAVEGLTSKDLWLDRVNADKGLARVSNAKLLRLHDTLEDAKKRFGSRDKLISAICKLEKREKDDGYKARLGSYPLPRLVDLHDSADKRAKKPAKATPPKKKLARSKKAQAKVAAK
jgi:hypothetical protein